MKRLLSSLLAVALLAACAPTTVRPAVVFSDYVAMGDSITAGVQSAGLTAASQRDSYARLLGARAGLSIVMPEVQDPGCPPPLNVPDRTVNCARRDPAVVSPVVGIPGARAADVLLSTDTRVENPDPLLYDARLYASILGPGVTQVGAALARKPKFITLWIGSNDVLLPTLRGRPDLATRPEEFRASYAGILDQLQPSGARIVLITVPDITRVPALIPVALLRLGGLADGSCNFLDAFFGTLSLAGASKDQPLSCRSEALLTRQEFNDAQTTVARYNAIIRELAAARGLAVFDVNPVLATLPGRPAVPSATEPFGPTFSLDGIHPSSLTHARLALELAKFLNARYGTTLDTR